MGPIHIRHQKYSIILCWPLRAGERLNTSVTQWPCSISRRNERESHKTLSGEKWATPETRSRSQPPLNSSSSVRELNQKSLYIANTKLCSIHTQPQSWLSSTCRLLTDRLIPHVFTRRVQSLKSILLSQLFVTFLPNLCWRPAWAGTFTYLIISLTDVFEPSVYQGLPPSHQKNIFAWTSSLSFCGRDTQTLRFRKYLLIFYTYAQRTATYGSNIRISVEVIKGLKIIYIPDKSCVSVHLFPLHH